MGFWNSSVGRPTRWLFGAGQCARWRSAETRSRET
jgi:hypothetical protein